MESLYRKYRPLTFESVVGQRHIVSTLEHAITEGRLSHAYLFCGPRGTGKTTMARILAKALLCERAAAARAEGASGCMPDGSCEECQRIAEGTHPDVYELDAASRTGVDNVREEIINSVSFAPVRGAYKIYIIDEVHMLTTQAFNALLKTLEEPPEHVLFVLCTTDPQKIPETILSRCQRFDFHRIGNEDIVGRLAYICEQEGFDYDAEALEIVAKHARGGMRDALSTLEQLSVFGNGSVHASDARALLGEVSGTVLSEFSRAIAARDVATLFGLVRTQVDAGEDLMELTRDLVAHTRDIYMVSVAGARPELFDGAEDVEALAEEAGLFGTADRLARALTVLDDAALEMRTAADTRLVLEIALTRLARPESDLTLEALAERIDRLESRIASGVPAAPLDASGVAALAGVRGAVAKAPVPNEAKASMPAGAPVSAEASAAAGTSGSAGTSKPDKVSAPAGAAVSAAEQAFAPAGAKTAEFARGQMASPAEGGASARSAASRIAGEAHRPSVSTPTEAAAAHVEERGTVPVAPVVPQDSRTMDPSVRAEQREADARSDQVVQTARATGRGPARAGGPGAEHASGPEAVRLASAAGRVAPTSAAVPSRPSAAAAPAASSRPSAAEIAASAAAPTPAVTDAGELQRKWSDVVKRVTAAQPSRGALLQSSRAQSDDGSALTVSFPPGSGFAITMLGRPDTQEIVLPQVCAVFGNRAVHYVMDGSAAAPKTSAPQPSAPAASVPEAPASAARPEATAPAGPQVAAESSAPAIHSSPAASASPDAPESVAKKPAATPAAQEPASGLSPDSAPWAPAPAEFGPAPEPALSVSERKLGPAPSEPTQAPAPAFTKPAQAPASEGPAWDDDQVPYDDAAAMAYDDDLPPFDMPGADLDAAASPSPASAAGSSAASAVAAPTTVSSAASTAGAPQVAAAAAPSAQAAAPSSSSQPKTPSSDVAQPAAPSSVPWATPAASPMSAAGGSSSSAPSASDSAPAMPAPSVSMGDEGADDIALVLGSVFGDGVKVTQVGGAE
ncbi:MAG TPA: DNA polymerase III subunit gamma/tau [Enorma massiliensis]|uniref:DNA polymerase III subunit gamma/tau n=1 Tax=Enorma massiliensis TaxID=1472761 RepID=UPI001DC53702|nr:DNA polymerase III subunit gamma/tau [Enorma massiliensis]HJG62044.1 DNA polymerase III subunit gamma/tau [Enorma massiliensis]